MAGVLEVPAPGPDAGGVLGEDQLVYVIKGCPFCALTATLTIEYHAVLLNPRREARPWLATLQQDVSLDGKAAKEAAQLVARLGAYRTAARTTSRTLVRPG